MSAMGTVTHVDAGIASVSFGLSMVDPPPADYCFEVKDMVLTSASSSDTTYHVRGASLPPVGTRVSYVPVPQPGSLLGRATQVRVMIQRG